MLRNLFLNNPKWKESSAHLLLLSKFTSPHQVTDFTRNDDWKEVLGEDPSKAIDMFAKDGYLVLGDVLACLDYKYKVPDLKKLLKTRGVKVSGNKNELINRLVEIDPTGMKKDVSGLKIFVCSDIGKPFAEEYKTNEKQKRLLVEEKTIVCLKKRDFREASKTVASYEAEQVFPRGMGMDWKNHNTRTDEKVLKYIFESHPKILKELKNENFETLRIAASMMYLWGVNTTRGWIPDNFETGIYLDRDATARMIWFYAKQRLDLERFGESGFIKEVEISTANDCCNECKKLARVNFRLSKAPELPYEKCTSKMGCRCCYISKFDL